MRTPNTFLASQRSQKWDSLYSFTKSHLICQYPIQLFVVQCVQPIKTNDLVLSESSIQQKWHFGFNLHTWKCKSLWLETLCHFHSLFCNFGSNRVHISSFLLGKDLRVHDLLLLIIFIHLVQSIAVTMHHYCYVSSLCGFFTLNSIFIFVFLLLYQNLVLIVKLQDWCFWFVALSILLVHALLDERFGV